MKVQRQRVTCHVSLKITGNSQLRGESAPRRAARASLSLETQQILQKLTARCELACSQGEVPAFEKNGIESCLEICPQRAQQRCLSELNVHPVRLEDARFESLDDGQSDIPCETRHARRPCVDIAAALPARPQPLGTHRHPPCVRATPAFLPLHFGVLTFELLLLGVDSCACS